jgi:CubicO group peptidase (beta-lactamase class C family)
MQFLTRLSAAWLLAVSLPLFAASAPFKGGTNPGKLTEISKSLAPFVETNLIAGAVTLVARQGKVVALDAIGYSDLGTRRRIAPDDLFWIASMTKPMTAVAVLMLQDEGKLSVEDPVEKHLPEFKNQWQVTERSATNLTLVKAARPIRIRDLLTHTSGLGDLSAPRGDCSLAELVMAYSQQPLKFPPGSKWEYCNSGINTLGRIVEVVSGKPYAKFLQERLFDPLDMDDTTFWPSRRQLKRVAKPYQAGPNGSLVEGSIFFLKGPLPDRTRTPFPAGGLFSTASDVARFYQMMLNGGVWRGKRLLSSTAVTELTRTQTGELKTGFVDGMSFGYGFAVVKEPKGVTRMVSPGTFGHGGAYGTQSWADPKSGLILVLMYQWSKVPNADASLMREAFQDAAVKALSE